MVLKSGLWAVLGAGFLLAVTGGTAYLLRFDAPEPQPEGMASDGTVLWVAGFQTGRLFQMDSLTGDVIRSYAAPGPRPEGLTWDGTHLWCADWETRKIYRLAVSDTALTVVRILDPPTVEATPPKPVGLAWDGQALWLTTWSPYWLWRIDPETGAPLRSLNLDPSPYGVPYPRPEDLAWDGTSLWITDWGSREIYRMDPVTLEVTRTIASAGPSSVGLTFHGGHLWNGDTGGTGVPPAIYKLEETGGTPVSPTTWGAIKRRYRMPSTKESR